MDRRAMLRTGGGRMRDRHRDRRVDRDESRRPKWFDMAADDEAGTLLQYRPLAIKVARKYRGVRHAKDAGYDEDDLFQIAWLGVLRAARTYRPDCGANFLTWTFNCAHWLVRAMLATKRKKEGFHGTLWPRSLDIPIDDDGTPWMALIPDEAPPELPNFTDLIDLADRILRERGDRGARLADLWRLRAEGMTLDQVGGKMGISRERVRQLQCQAADILTKDERWRQAWRDAID